MVTIMLRKSRNSLKVGIYLLPFSNKQTKKVCGRIDSSNNVLKKTILSQLKESRY